MTTLTTQGRVAPPLGEGGAGFLTATGQTAKRTLLQYRRTPQLLLLPTLTGIAFLFCFRYVLGGAIQTGGGKYVDFLMPGFLAQIVLWTALNIAAGVGQDATSGVHDRLRSLPIPRVAAVVGRSLADSALNIFALTVIAGLGFAIGFRAHAGAPSVLGAFALMVAEGYACTWVFIAFGLIAGNAQAAQGLASVIVVLFTFVSGAFVPVDSMPAWLRGFAAHQPVTVFINGVRSLMLGGTGAAGAGHSTTYWVLLSLLWCAAILLAFGAVAVVRFSRTQ
jgi:ABC-2 type transport system permease protein